MNLREIYAKYRLEQGQAGQVAQVRVEEIPAPYYLGEIMVLRHCTEEQLMEIHKAKLTYPGVRLIQESAETCEERPYCERPKVASI